MSQRLFSFHGNDQEYIAFLEYQCISAQWAGQCAGQCVGHLGGLTELETPMGHGTAYQASPSDGLQIVQYTPNLPRDNSQISEREPRWMRELRAFISALPSEKSWGVARGKAGINTPSKNQLALRLMLGHANATTFRAVGDAAIRRPMHRTENQDLVTRGYHYAEFIQRCTNDLSFTASVVSFQSLIFVSYCVVMIHSGISKETTNNMMRRYIVRNNDDFTLGGYRRGVTWINRCIAELLVNGWGHMSWEFFLFERRSLAQFARFTASDIRSYRMLVQHLGKADVPLQEEGWIPYCIPCIVQSLAGDIIGLERICHILDYGPEAKSKILSLSRQLTRSIQDLAGQPIEQ